jgi:hypothetical protein
MTRTVPSTDAAARPGRDAGGAGVQPHPPDGWPGRRCCPGHRAIRYLGHLLSSSATWDWIDRRAAGSAVRAISTHVLLELPLELLQTFDAEAEMHERHGMVMADHLPGGPQARGGGRRRR